ncbi:MAG: hypothetical protein KAV18_04415 [Candidatus Omnitrophica bacterium]|nr:hypothetical protein [Candidatus Omnitrophota bacterium]
MSNAAIAYSSPAIARTLAEKTQKKTSKLPVVIKGKKDVGKFIAEMYAAQTITASSKLFFK